jgi:hypothetical protein
MVRPIKTGEVARRQPYGRGASGAEPLAPKWSRPARTAMRPGGTRKGTPSAHEAANARMSQPVSGTDAPAPARVTLSSDLSGSLKYLDDAQLERLREAVTLEINRRNPAPKNETVAAEPTKPSSKGQPASRRNKRTSGFDEIPEGKANLIRASFKAGVKSAAIARIFRMSQSLVNRVLSTAEK